MTDIAKVAIQADTTGLKKGEAALKNFKKVGDATEKSIAHNTNGMRSGFNSVSPAISKTAKAASDATPKMQGFGHQSRMVSMQLSQVAQQASATGNWMQALAIQLPDLMLGFGTVGILIGAAAGALGSYFVSAARDAENASSDLADEIDELAGKYEKLGIAQKELLRLKMADEAKNIAIENRKLQGDLDTAAFKLDRLNDGYARGRIDVLEYTEAERELRKVIADSRAGIEANNQTLKARKAILDGTAESEKAMAKSASDSLKFRNKLEDDAQALMQKYESPAERAKRTMAEEKAVLANAYSQNIIDFQSYKEAKKRIDEDYIEGDLARTRAAEAQKYQLLTSGQQAGLGILGGLFGQMASIAQQGGEKMFQEYKNLATAQALISTSLAVANTLANPLIPPPYNFALAGAVGAMGAVQVAMIQGQSYQGARAMGGQVEKNGRYLVGENGPEVLQLGSQGGNITPNHALEGGAQVTNVFQISTGVAETAQAEILKAVPFIEKLAVNAVNSAARKGGSTSRIVGAR